MTGSDGTSLGVGGNPSVQTSPTAVVTTPPKLKEDVVLRMEKPLSERTRQWVRITFAGLNGLAFILVIAAVILASRNMGSVRDNYTRLGVIRRTSINSKALFENVLDAETGQRGFLITENPSFLQPYTDAVSQVEESYGRLLNNSVDDPQILTLIRGVHPYLDRKLFELNRTLSFSRNGDRAGAIALVLAGTGKIWMDILRANLSSIQTRLDYLEEDARENAVGAITYLEVTVYGSLGVIAAVILVGCLTFLLSDSRAQQRTNDELRGLLAAARSATKVKSMFLASMSHEIRTPMNGVVAIAEELNNTPLTGEQRGMLDIIRSSADAMMRLINDILLFSKVEAAKFNLLHERFDLHQFLQPLGQISYVRAVAKNIGFKLDISSDTPRYLLTDPGRLRQVLVNLIDNALKFTHKGEVTLTTKLAKITRLPSPAPPPPTLAGNQPGMPTSSPSATPPRGIDYSREVEVLFEVQDTGIGIAEAAQALIFQPFTQAEHTTTRDYGGTGLGLTVCSELVKLMGGELKIRSQMGQGTCFYFTVKSSYVDPVEADKEVREQALIFDDDDEPEHKEIEVGVASSAFLTSDMMTSSDGMIGNSVAASTYASFAGSAHGATINDTGLARGLLSGSSSSNPLDVVIEMTSPVTTSLAPATQSSPGREMVAGIHSSHPSAVSGTSMSVMTSDATSPHGAIASMSSGQQARMSSSPQSQMSASGVAGIPMSSSGSPALPMRTIPLLPTLTIPPETMTTSNGTVVVVPARPASNTPPKMPAFHADPTVNTDDGTLATRHVSSTSLMGSPQWNSPSPITIGEPQSATAAGAAAAGANGSTNSSPSTGTRKLPSGPPSPAQFTQRATHGSNGAGSHVRNGSGNGASSTPQSNGHSRGTNSREDSGQGQIRSQSRSGSHSGNGDDVVHPHQLTHIPSLPPRHLVPMHHPINVHSGMMGSTRSDDTPTVGTHAGSTPSFSSLSTGTGGGLRILVAEDNQINQRVLIRLLARGRHRVVLCTNGKQAADVFLARPAAFDCIIMDIHMPVMDGLAATRLIRQHEQAAIHHQMRTAALVAPAAASSVASSPAVSHSGNSPSSTPPLFPDISPVVSSASSLPPNTGRRPSPPLSATTAAAAAAPITAAEAATSSGFPAANASVWPRPYTRVPIIAATAGAADEDGQQCLAAGMDMVITKPIDRKALQRKLAKIPSRFSTFDSI